MSNRQAGSETLRSPANVPTTSPQVGFSLTEGGLCQLGNRRPSIHSALFHRPLQLLTLKVRGRPVNRAPKLAKRRGPERSRGGQRDGAEGGCFLAAFGGDLTPSSGLPPSTPAQIPEMALIPAWQGVRAWPQTHIQWARSRDTKPLVTLC